jgi:hypothetical protein
VFGVAEPAQRNARALGLEVHIASAPDAFAAQRLHARQECAQPILLLLERARQRVTARVRDDARGGNRLSGKTIP